MLRKLDYLLIKERENGLSARERGVGGRKKRRGRKIVIIMDLD